MKGKDEASCRQISIRRSYILDVENQRSVVCAGATAVLDGNHRAQIATSVNAGFVNGGNIYIKTNSLFKYSASRRT